MSKNNQFKVKVNDTFSFSLNHDQTGKLDLIKTPSNKLHLVKDDNSILVEVISRDFNSRQYTLKINGNEYKVAVESQLDALIDELGLAKGLLKKVNNVNAPMPGQIIEVNVKPGQEVKENDPLLILEAMKMENVMVSPRDGVIKEIMINTKDVVEKGQLLVEFE
jgi:biotin carboxyl carrier protein